MRIGRFAARLAVGALVATLASGAAPVAAEPVDAVPPGAEGADGVVVTMRAGHDVDRVASAAGARVAAGATGRTFHLKVAGSELGATLAKLRRDARVALVEPNARYRAAVVPNDPCLASACPAGTSPQNTQWGLSRVGAFAAWDVTRGSSSVLVAVLDSGIDRSHPDLAGKFVVGPKYADPGTDDVVGHGTHVSGTIAAMADNGMGVAGLGWHTRVLSIKVLRDSDGSGSLFHIAQGLNAAVQLGAKVVNFSLSGGYDAQTLRTAVHDAQRAGVVVVSAAGNDGDGANAVQYPAAYPGVVAAAASLPDDRLAPFSQHGGWVTMSAPGYRVVSTVPGGGYELMSGTSMATPHIAAAAALVLAAHPGIGPAAVVSRLALASDEVAASGRDVRYGRLNVRAALVTAGPGYWMVATDGGVFSFGESRFYGSTGSIRLNQPIVGMAAVPRRRGYWFVASDGGVFGFGGAEFFGSAAGAPLGGPIVGMAAAPDGRGYWLAGADGAVHARGSANPSLGDGRVAGLRAPVVGITATPSGGGYWLVAADGAVLPFGDAGSFGSMAGHALNRPVVGMTATATGGGYWLVASDGGMFSFGDARFLGSMGGHSLNRPIVGMRSTPSGAGYWLVASDGGMFSFGDARFHGSMGATPLNRPVVGMG